MTVDTHDSGAAGRFAAGRLLPAVPLLFFAVACINAEPEVPKTGQKKQQCESTRDSALDKAQPNVFGIRFKPEDVVGGLNDWQQECLKDTSTRGVIGEDANALLKRAWKPAEIKRLKQGLFDDRDAYHLRNSLLFGEIRREIAKRTSDRNNDRQQVMDLFEFVVRNVELIDKHPHSLPMPIFRALLRGKGTVEDRAWLFASLLRQLQVPAVILSPMAETKSSPFLVGVLLENKVYLFDTRLGVPVPAPDRDPNSEYISRPATLQQFLADPSIAKSLGTAEHPYPLKPADLAKPRVRLIGHRSVWAPHMKDLLEPMYNRCIVYVNLENESQGEGLIQRVSDLGKRYWKKEDLEIWAYPDRVFSDYAALEPQQRSQLNALFRPFTAPRPVGLKKAGNKVEAVVGNATHRQFESRVLQLTGSYQKCGEGYVFLRREAGEFKDSGIQDTVARLMYETADDDADFWVGVAQYEQYRRLRRDRPASAVDQPTRDRLKNAINSLDGYYQRAGTRDKPSWLDQSHYLNALCHVELWNILRHDAKTDDKALQSAKRIAADRLRRLKSVPTAHPGKAGFELARLRLERLLARTTVKRPKRNAAAPRKPVAAPRPSRP